ncbi:SNF2 family N-terminal domain-containing protein [Achaetomium macrosporum]|uniref:SNF2 family N-terminal domain-containing protein n=1 Tax=Achaetomium macrosporum TaxID=79813 RepID=A0AAN7HGU0_9PEZI|nr:SNF2 family N-terminal domain-containing protein [Achaetomium macrosporum]
MVRTRRSAVAEDITAASPQPDAMDASKRPGGRRSASSETSDSSAVFTSATAPSFGSRYTTPLTSNTATPTETETARASGKRLSRIEVQLPAVRAPVNRTLKKSIFSMNSKRKRDVVDDSEEDFSDTSPDAVLARKLQAEEDAAATRVIEPSLESGHALRRSLRGVAEPATASTSRLSKAADGNRPTPTAAGRAKGTTRLGAARVPSSGKTASKRRAITVADSEDDESAAAESDEEGDSDEPLQTLSRPRRVTARTSAKSKALPSLSETSKAKKVRKAVTAPASEEDDDDDDDDDDDEEPPDVDTSDTEFGWKALASDSSGVSEAESDVEDADAANGDDDDDNGSSLTAAQRSALRIAMSTRRAYRQYANKRRVKKDRARLEEHHPELTTMWKELENMPILKAGKAEQPESISRPLKPFQLEGLAWMMAMEKTQWKGGLLGDEMGLGKTIQAVSLIMSDFGAVKKPSLVLVPPVALMQWMTEIEAYTDGRLKTLVFHGTNSKSKNLTVAELKKYNVIIMSYNSLESMYRKQEKGFQRKDGLLKEKSIIHQTEFHRVILDEAHCIKTRTTMTAKACFALKVTYRWCLSGTPLQNRIGEFFSLVRFLNIRPFACYLCKHCPCSTLEWQMDEDSRCTSCKHGGMQHVSVFNQELLNPIQKFGNRGRGAEAFKKLRILTDRIMLRRLKKDHTDSMELPVKEINVERQFFGEEENDFANSIMTNGQRKFDTYVASGVLLNNYANIFGLIMQMRQVADHPDLILKKNSEGGQNILVCNICDEPAEDAIRSRCKHDFCRTCVKSYLNSTTDPNCPQCHIPLSIDLEQPEIEQDEALVKKSSIINRIKMENWTSSSKIELLVHELHKLRSDNASHKSIIFSQFTTMLQLIEWRLRRAGITTVMLDGSMTPAQRQASINHFMTNVDVECFLVSLKAGGVALNLTEASRVFIVDPWWNPAAEWQSADRCHRIGQTRPCTITRLCIEDSVESRMVLLQEKKTSMINSTINADDAAMDSLSPEDLQFLFRGT